MLRSAGVLLNQSSSAFQVKGICSIMPPYNNSVAQAPLRGAGEGAASALAYALRKLRVGSCYGSLPLPFRMSANSTAPVVPVVPGVSENCSIFPYSSPSS